MNSRFSFRPPSIALICFIFGLLLAVPAGCDDRAKEVEALKAQLDQLQAENERLRQRVPASTSEATERKPAVSAPPDLAAQALAEGTKHLEKYGTWHGGSFYCQWKDGSISERKDLKPEIRPAKLSEADKLNGVEFRGVILWSASAYRQYEGSSGWGQWSSGGSLDQHIEKRRGRSWQLSIPNPPGFKDSRPPEGSVPPG